MEDTSSDLVVESHTKRARSYSADDSADRKHRRVFDDDDGESTIEFLDDDFLGILDDPEDGDPPIQGLDSVIRSFEEEIAVLARDASSPVVLDQPTGDASDKLGYLLEASDDELGLPPSFANSADESSSHEVPELLDISSSEAFATPFDGEMPNYDNFDLGHEINNVGMEVCMLGGGLFDLADGWDVPEVMWRPESLPAV